MVSSLDSVLSISDCRLSFLLFLFHYIDIRSTLRQTYVEIPYNTNATGSAMGHVGSQDLAKNTMKQTYVEVPYNTNATGSSMGSVGYQDSAKNTIKQTYIETPYNTNATGSAMGQVPLQDLAKKTLKQTYIEIPYHNITTGINQIQGQATTFNRTPLKSTIKQTLIETPFNTNATGSQMGQTPLQDQARSTLKQILIETPLNTNATGPQQGQTPLQDQARSTLKQTLIETPYNSITTGISQTQGQASTFDRTPLKTTIKETMEQNKRIAKPDHTTTQGYGYMSANMVAPETLKQFRCQKTFTAPALGPLRERSYESAYNAETNSRKEKLFCYRAPTDSGPAIGPQVENLNVNMRSDDHTSRVPNIGFTYEWDSRINPTSSTNSNKLSSYGEGRFIDPVLLNQLQSNPYNIEMRV